MRDKGNLELLEIFCTGEYNSHKTDLEILLMAQAKIAVMIAAEIV